MRAPLPYGLFVTGGRATESDLRQAEALAREVTNVRVTGGLMSHTMREVLADGGVVTAEYAGGTFRVFIDKAQEPVDDPTQDLLYVPMLFSGVVNWARLLGDEGAGVRFTEATRRRITKAVGTQGWEAPAEARMQRFRIGYNTDVVPEFEPVDGFGFYTQYVRQRPTWYSGAMAEVMQVVGGYGRQDLDQLPDDPVERCVMRIPAKVREKISPQLREFSQPWCEGIPPTSGEFQYDYKFSGTDAVAFDDEGKPWLVHVKERGVFAMPLPMIPAATTAAFREWVEEEGDDELLSILERFGGLPSGEAMPRDEQGFEAWRRAGAIIKVCGVGDFYEHNAYTKACGWAFNGRGSEAFNTCYSYDGDGVAVGFLYKLRLNLSAVQAADGQEAPGDEVAARRLNGYVSALSEMLRGDDVEMRAARFKVGRATTAELMARADATAGQPTEAEVSYWVALEARPIAAHAGAVTRVGSGPLYHHAKFFDQPQIKFPDVADGTVLSFDFTPLDEDAKPKRCDTVMYAYYAGETLRTVKYFYDPREFQKFTDGNFDECMTVGQWEQTEHNSPTWLQGHFYTTDFDERDEVTGETVYTRVIGKDLGYDSHPKYGFVTPVSMGGRIWRSRYYTHDMRRETRVAQSKLVAVCIPFYSRCALLHADKFVHDGGSDTESCVLKSMDDPHSYGMWTYHPVSNWAPPDLGTMTGVPYPEFGTPVWVEERYYNPTRCNDFADEGDWVGAMPADYAWLVRGPYSPAGTPPTVQQFARSSPVSPDDVGKTQFQYADGADPVNKKPAERYFISSPDRYGFKWYRDATGVRFGDSVYYSSDEPDPDDVRRRKRWGFTRLADHTSPHHFVGVIHE